MKKLNAREFKGLMTIAGVMAFILFFFGLIQITSFIYLLKETPGLLNILLLK